ncbi:alpha-amylase family glycosyl hydrolase [Mycoplasma sp. 392]
MNNDFLNKKYPKLNFYELKVDKFLDTNNSGFGDYQGVERKIEYFEKMNFNVILFNNILDYYQELDNINEIHNRYGSLYDLRRMVKLLAEKNIASAVTIDIKKIQQTYTNFKRANQFYDNNKTLEEQKELSSLERYVSFEHVRENKIDLNSNILSYYETILKFYGRLGFKYIFIENAEVLQVQKSDTFSSELIQKLKEIYIMTKRYDGEIKLVLSADNVSHKFIKKLLSADATICDYVFLNYFALIGRDKNYKNYLMRTFRPAKLFKEIKKYSKLHQFIISLASDKTGRINSRWGDENAYKFESAKSLALLLFSSANSTSTYYGDELGMLKAKISDNSQYKIANFNEIKRNLESKNISNEKFLKSISYQHPISTNGVMSWSNQLNAGFSQQREISFTKPENFKEINFTSEANNKNSPLNFYRFLLSLVNDDDWGDLMKYGSTHFRISLNRKILKVIRKHQNQKMIFVVNLSKKPRHYKVGKKWQIFASSYSDKTYTTIPEQLDAFESLILVKKDDDIEKFNVEK